MSLLLLVTAGLVLWRTVLWLYVQLSIEFCCLAAVLDAIGMVARSHAHGASCIGEFKLCTNLKVVCTTCIGFKMS